MLQSIKRRLTNLANRIKALEWSCANLEYRLAKLEELTRILAEWEVEDWT